MDCSLVLGRNWGQISDPPLIETLGDHSSEMRVLAIYALEKLKAKEALPQLHALLDDEEKIHFDGLGSVSERLGRP